jgi:hypothetical protein
MDNEYTIQDLISFSHEQKPIEFQQAFNSLIVDRLAAAVNTKKFEMASTLYSDKEEVIDSPESIDQEESKDDETT